MRSLLLGLIAASVLGCVAFDGEDTATIDDACLAICECQFFSPNVAKTCASQCVAEQNQFPVAPDCLSCIAGSTCDVLTTGGCSAVCTGDEPQPGE